MTAKRKPASIMVKLSRKERCLRNARIIGPVKVRKHTSKGHLQIEIHGIEIDGFGPETVDRKPHN